MKKSSLFVLILLLSLASLVILNNLEVKAEPQTIVIPDDYTTVQEAITSASEGDTIYVKKGIYEGPINQTIVVDKMLLILGENVENTMLKLYPAYNVTWILTQPFFSYSDAITLTADGSKLLNLTVIIRNPGGFISVKGNQIQMMGNNITTGPTTGVNVDGDYCSITDNVMGGQIRLKGFFNEVTRNSLYRIYVEGSSNNVNDNICKGIGLGNSTDTTVSGNRVTSSTRSYSGISLTNSNNNFIHWNYVSGFQSGLRLWFSSNNTITSNNIADSLDASISLGSSSNNTFSLNNFIDNMFSWTPYVYDYYTDSNHRNANPEMTASTNFWENGSKGNYWARAQITTSKEYARAH